MGLSERDHLFGVLSGGLFHRDHRSAEVLIYSGEVSPYVTEPGAAGACDHSIHIDVSADRASGARRGMGTGGDIEIFLAEYDQPADRRSDLFADQRICAMCDDLAAEPVECIPRSSEDDIARISIYR